MPQAEVVKIGQLVVKYLIDGSASQGLGIFELTIPSGSNVPPPHSHTHNEECVYVLEGTLRYSVDGESRDLRPGEWMRTPKGSVHGFSNPHQENARALIALTPDIGAQYFRDVAAVINSGGPPDVPKLLAVMARYGLKPAPRPS
ncbi:MAG: cupin domain-containing protein [Gammaproteobacteria bacterium]|nr:cupin domain-containing protein [Gammaproteobacteria bacterium]MDE2346636.1 cupin domain-containing protein [Gammaproteobacteria bacterium]